FPAAGLLAGGQEHLPARRMTGDAPGPPGAASPGPGRSARAGERRWPMALAVLTAGALRAILRAQLRAGDARWLLVLVLVLAVLVGGEPGRIDRDSTWLRVMTATLIGVISLVNATAVVRLVTAITIGQAKFTRDANVLL